MKKVILFLISFTYLSHQIIMPAQKTFNYPATQYLWNSIRNNNPIATQDAIAKGADLSATDCFGYTALMIVANHGYIEIVSILIENNANVNAQDNSKKTALMFAAYQGHTETVRILVNKGADVNAKDNECKTALLYAINNGHTEIVRILVNHKADVNVKDCHGKTALILAALTNRTEIAQILVNHNANVNAQTNIGLTALMFAADNRHTKIVQILLNFGANPDYKDIFRLTAREMNPSIIDKAILANRENIQKLQEEFIKSFQENEELSNYSHLASTKLSQTSQQSANGQVIQKMAKLIYPTTPYNWKTSKELTETVQ